ncbi:MAG: hypothetical protein A3E80_04260 [Chlamydiae bacterium RIFCSPHIGHO2_12_FULL_49_9]|nr:MAG: hypothetical protein A3E80_04260 [Chlamydiae bacterium RIFCSPHIGHO2_12_FULL_49_9]
MKHRSWIALSGFLWFSIGGSLLYKGLKFISQGPSQETGTMLIALGLAIGFLKGRFVLSKTVARVSNRIAALPLPIRFRDAFSKSYWILIGSMMALGILFRFLPIPIEVRGLIDVAIGSALINGSMLYFRASKRNS